MIDVCVSREFGCCECLELAETDCEQCVVGDEISNNLIKTDLVAASAGRAVLDDQGTNKRRIQGTCSLYEYMKPKTIVEVTDRVHGTFNGKLAKFSLQITVGLRGEMSARSNIEVIKVHDESVT